jgi:hypothetical protein
MSPATPWPPLAGRTTWFVTALLIAGSLALGLGVATMRARREPPSLEEDVVMGRIGDVLAGRYHAENAHHLGMPPFERASAGLKFHLWLESVANRGRAFFATDFPESTTELTFLDLEGGSEVSILLFRHHDRIVEVHVAGPSPDDVVRDLRLVLSPVTVLARKVK